MAVYYDGLKDTVKDKISRNRPDTLRETIKDSITIDNRIYDRMLEKKGRTSFQHLSKK